MNKMSIRICVFIGVNILLSLVGCKKNSVESIGFLFTPAFNHHSQFEIDISNEFLVYYNNVKDCAYPNQNKPLDCQVEEYSIHPKDLNAFLDQTSSAQCNSTIDHSRTLLDGIGFRVCKVLHTGDTLRLTSSSPRRTKEYKKEYILLDSFFDLAYKTISNYKTVTYLEDIQHYFDYQLPIKRVSNIPLEYRIWSRIDDDDQTQLALIHFLDSLPSDKPVLFDVRNGGMSVQSQAIFETYHFEKKMFFYGYNGLLSLKEIKAYEADHLKRRYRHPEFFGDFDFDKEIEFQIKQKWQTLSCLKTFQTKKELLKALK